LRDREVELERLWQDVLHLRRALLSLSEDDAVPREAADPDPPSSTGGRLCPRGRKV